MSHTFDSLITCPTIQAKLNDQFTKADPGTLREPIPFIEFLTSGVNTSGALQNQISSGNGKIRSVELVYEPRLGEDDVSTSAIQSCTSTKEGGQRMWTYELDRNVGSEINQKFQLSDLATICESDELFIARQIQKMMDAAIRHMATKTWGQVAALKGNFGPSVTPNGSEELVVKTKKSTALGNGIDTDFIEQISFASNDMIYPSVPYIFGWGETYKAFQRVKAGCCSASGLDVGKFAQQEGMAFMPDYRVEAAFGADHFIGLAAGALQLLTYNEYQGAKGVRVIDTENYKQTIIRDPETNIAFDFMWKFDCGNIYAQVKLAHKLVGAPPDMFFIDDRLYGVNWVNEYLITNPA